MDAHQKLIAVFLFFLLIIISAESTENTKSRSGRFGKDPTVETSFLPDRYSLTHIQSHLAPSSVFFVSKVWICFSEREAEEQAERERLRKLWFLEQERIRSNSDFWLLLFLSHPFPYKQCSQTNACYVIFLRWAASNYLQLLGWSRA